MRFYTIPKREKRQLRLKADPAQNLPVARFDQTWNSSAVTFYGFEFNVTNRASASASRIFRWMVDGNSYLTYTSAGVLRLKAALQIVNATTADNNINNVYIDANGVAIQGGSGQITFTTNFDQALTNIDMRIGRAANDTLYLRGDRAASSPIVLQLQGRSSTTSGRLMLGINCEWVSSTDASRTTRTKFTASDSAAEREVIRIEANGSAALLGFYGTTAVAQQTVTGSRGGNAALADLLSKLAALGLIVDGTTA
jgi:hypothetical protein